MKPLQIFHLAGTLVLLCLALGFGALVLGGVVRVSLRSDTRPGVATDSGLSGRPASDRAISKARLVVIRSAKPNAEYPIYEGENVIGRADEKPVDIDLEIHEVPERIWSSRQHAVITCLNSSLVIEDLNSSNGTYVNGSRVIPGKEQPLKSSDVIQIGEVQMKVVL
jgi:hypothetical protein